MKTGLVLEGGGIRSSYLAGVLQALWDKDVRHFDVIAGTSAGACCGVSFITGELQKNRLIREEHLTGNNFVKYHNIPTFKNVVDIDFLIDRVCGKLVPLDLKKIKNAETKFFVSASDFLTGETVYFNNHEHDILEALRASCAMPYFYRAKAIYQGRRYLDGGLTDSIPVQKAISEGCNHILVIGTRPRGYLKTPSPCPDWVHRFFYPDCLILPQAFKNRHLHYNGSLDLIRVKQSRQF